MARELRTRKLRTQLIPDETALDVIRNVDLVLVGADAVLATGAIIHKVGTHPVALLARERHVPLYVVTGRSKFVDRCRAPRPLPALFDLTPAQLVTAIWTDRGPWRPGDKFPVDR